MYQLSQRSLRNLEGVHPDLIRVVELAIRITSVDFGITEGLRTLDRQRYLVSSGASTTMRSRHLTGHAVDLVAYLDGEVRWDWPLYDRLALAMKDAAETLGVPIEWGGDWTHFKDGPHFQLPWGEYPE